MQDAPQALIERPRFQIRTKDDVAKALLMIRNTKKLVEELEENVKERAKALMEKENVSVITLETLDQKTGEVQNWEIRKTEASNTEEYRPENVIAAIGIESAAKFLKVKGGDLKKYLTTESAKGNLSMERVEQAVSNPTIVTRKGMISVREVKPRA